MFVFSNLNPNEITVPANDEAVKKQHNIKIRKARSAYESSPSGLKTTS